MKSSERVAGDLDAISALGISALVGRLMLSDLNLVECEIDGGSWK